MTTLNSPELSFLDGSFDGNEARPWPEGSYGVDNSGFKDYCRFSLIPDVEQKITHQLQSLEPGTGLDVAGGANGVAVQDLLDNELIERGVFTGYQEARNPETVDRPDLDFIAGDIKREAAWRAIFQWQDEHSPQGFNIIMHRPFGMLGNMHPHFYAAAGNLLLDRLAPGGILFSQIAPCLLVKDKGLGYRGLARVIRERTDIEYAETTKLIFGDHHFSSAMALLVKKS